MAHASNLCLEFNNIMRTRQAVSGRNTADKQTRQLLLYLFANTRGGHTRLRIIMRLFEMPSNTHQLACNLGLDYKAIQHHMRMLEKNNMVDRIGAGYGTPFYPSNLLEANVGTLDDVVARLDRKINHKKVYI